MKPCNCKSREMCIDSRPCQEHRRRRYSCPECKSKWTTIEVVVNHVGKGQRAHDKLIRKYANTAYWNFIYKMQQLLKEELDAQKEIHPR